VLIIKGLNAAHRTVRAAWIAGTVGLFALMLLPTALPAFGHHVFVVRGASMEPAIPLGSIVVVHAVDPADVHVGEVLTFRLPQGTIVTHRVTGIKADEHGLAFHTKGDASESVDPVPVPAADIVGEVETSVPLVGYLIFVLGSTAGAMLSVLILASLLMVAWSVNRLLKLIGPAPPRSPARQAP